MAAVANLFSDGLLRSLTPAQLEQFDDETLRRLANIVRTSQHDHMESLFTQEVASFDAVPLLWLTQHTATENPQYEKQGLPFLAPFPKRSYYVRTMMTSWAAVAWATWRAQFHREETVVQTANEDKCAHLIDYCRQLLDNQDPWLRDRHPLVKRSTYALAWRGGGEGSSIRSGENKIRAFHPTWYVQDESAHIPEGEACLGAVLPTGARVICISSAAPGWFADVCQR